MFCWICETGFLIYFHKCEAQVKIHIKKSCLTSQINSMSNKKIIENSVYYIFFRTLGFNLYIFEKIPSLKVCIYSIHITKIITKNHGHYEELEDRSNYSVFEHMNFTIFNLALSIP